MAPKIVLKKFCASNFLEKYSDTKNFDANSSNLENTVEKSLR